MSQLLLPLGSQHYRDAETVQSTLTALAHMVQKHAPESFLHDGAPFRLEDIRKWARDSKGPEGKARQMAPWCVADVMMSELNDQNDRWWLWRATVVNPAGRPGNVHTLDKKAQLSLDRWLSDPTRVAAWSIEGGLFRPGFLLPLDEGLTDDKRLSIVHVRWGQVMAATEGHPDRVLTQRGPDLEIARSQSKTQLMSAERWLLRQWAETAPNADTRRVLRIAIEIDERPAPADPVIVKRRRLTACN